MTGNVYFYKTVNRLTLQVDEDSRSIIVKVVGGDHHALPDLSREELRDLGYMIERALKSTDGMWGENR